MGSLTRVWVHVVVGVAGGRAHGSVTARVMQTPVKGLLVTMLPTGLLLTAAAVAAAAMCHS